ncbi:MAG: glycosyltransferase family 4 protein [Candidatus Sericytochromatia bacterium]|nr:glycosyltransferase family 4 protein [Candidatus Sericytochromatia bacterium]
MKITLLASDENTAPLYRVRALAKLLQSRFTVQVLGFNARPDRLEADAPRDFPYQAFPLVVGSGYRRAEAELRRAITGDLVYAMKARPTSFGLALRHRRATGLPVVVDVDDWERAMIAPWSKYTLKNALYALPRLGDPNNYLATWLAERGLSQADGLTVVSRHFQQRHGGLLAPHYVDTDHYDPARYARGPLRERLGLGEEAVFVFAGIAHPSKGLGDLLAALQTLSGTRRAWRLLVVGPITPEARAIARTDPRVRLLGCKPPSDTPRYLAVADMVVLPQRPSAASLGQVPMKLLEAMAMGVPIVSTAVSDIPAVLAGCGVVVPPLAPRPLRAAIAELLSDPAAARAFGQAARARVLERYSWQTGAREIGDYLLAVRAGQRPDLPVAA